MTVSSMILPWSIGAASIYHDRITVILCSDSLDTENRDPTIGPAAGLCECVYVYAYT
jgi:hypothetical protein